MQTNPIVTGEGNTPRVESGGKGVAWADYWELVDERDELLAAMKHIVKSVYDSAHDNQPSSHTLASFAKVAIAKAEGSK